MEGEADVCDLDMRIRVKLTAGEQPHSLTNAILH